MTSKIVEEDALQPSQQKRRQPAVFTHKNSKDLLPLDMRVGTSKDVQPHALVRKKQSEDVAGRVTDNETKGDKFDVINEASAEDQKHLPLLVKCQSKNDEFEAVIDTGSSYTIISSKRAEKCGLKKLRDHGYGDIGASLHKTCVKVRDQIEQAEITLGGCDIHCNLLITDEEKFDLLIGMDTLREIKALIDLDRNVLTIDDKEISFVTKSDFPVKQ